MEYVSQKIAKIAKEKGFDEECYTAYTERKLYTGLVLSHGKNAYRNSEFGTSIAAPSYQQLIEWIFSKIANRTNQTGKVTNGDIVWLEEWYNILIPELYNTWQVNNIDNKEEFKTNIVYNEFILEGFIGMLLNWFEKNNYMITIKPTNNNTFQYYIIDPSREGTVFGYRHIRFSINTKVTDCKSLQQVRHDAILKCFELMKGE